MTNPVLGFTGSGQVGPVVDWSITEEATPASIADLSAGVGSASIRAAAVDESIYLNDNPCTFADDGLTWDGRVASASIQGSAVTIQAEGALRFLNAVKTAPPTGTFIEPLATVGRGALTSITDVAWDSSGNLFVFDSGTYRVVKFSPAGTNAWSAVATTAYSTAGTADGQFGGRCALACGPDGSVYVADTVNNRVQKFTNALVFVAKQGTAGSGTTNYQAPQDIGYDASTGSLAVMDAGNVRVKIITTALVYVSAFASGLDFSTLAVAADGGIALGGNTSGAPEVDYFAPITRATTTSLQEASGLAFDPAGRLWVADFTKHEVRRVTVPALVTLGAVSSYGTAIGNFSSVKQIDVDSAGRMVLVDFYTNWVQVIGGATGADDLKVSLSSVIQSYIELCDPGLASHTFSYVAAADPQVAFPGWVDSVWTKLKQLCAAYNVELYYSGGVIYVGGLGSRSVDITNRTVAATTPQSVLPARSVVVVNQNATAANGAIAYNAAITNTIHTVEVNASLSVIIGTPHSLASINDPDPYARSTYGGTYAVQDSTGATVSATLWTMAGGSVSVHVGDASGQIVLTVTGPPVNVPGFTGPYSLAAGTGTTRVAVLSITGSGIFAAPQLVTINTGADELRITQSIGQTVDVPFITDATRARDRGVWAAASYLFNSTVALTVPHDPTLNIGDYAGRRFQYRDAMYRVTKAVHTIAGVQLTARWHTTVGDLDAVWASLAWNVSNADALWGTRLTQDEQITPLRVA